MRTLAILAALAAVLLAAMLTAGCSSQAPAQVAPEPAATIVPTAAATAAAAVPSPTPTAAGLPAVTVERPAFVHDDRQPPGKVYAVLTVTIANPGPAPFVVDGNTFDLVDVGGVRSYARFTGPVPEAGKMIAGTLLAGQSRTGKITYEVADTPGMTYTLLVMNTQKSTNQPVLRVPVPA